MRERPAGGALVPEKVRRWQRSSSGKQNPHSNPFCPQKTLPYPKLQGPLCSFLFYLFLFYFFFPPNIFNRDVSGVPFHADKPKMPQENFKAVFQVSSRDLQLNLQPHENKKTPNILSSKTRIDAQKILWNFLPCKYMMQYLSFGSLVQHAHFTTKMITD